MANICEDMSSEMEEWLEGRASEVGVTFEQLVAHILLEYREVYEDSDAEDGQVRT